MAEVQTSTNSGELAQRFIEFVMMQAQNAALFLGQIPNPQTGKGEVNLEVAKMFIDQLAMIQEKTRGNLSGEESTVLRNALSNLQLAYVEVARGSSAAASFEKKLPRARLLRNRSLLNLQRRVRKGSRARSSLRVTAHKRGLTYRNTHVPRRVALPRSFQHWRVRAFSGRHSYYKGGSSGSEN